MHSHQDAQLSSHHQRHHFSQLDRHQHSRLDNHHQPHLFNLHRNPARVQAEHQRCSLRQSLRVFLQNSHHRVLPYNRLPNQVESPQGLHLFNQRHSQVHFRLGSLVSSQRQLHQRLQALNLHLILLHNQQFNLQQNLQPNQVDNHLLVLVCNRVGNHLTNLAVVLQSPLLYNLPANRQCNQPLHQQDNHLFNQLANPLFNQASSQLHLLQLSRPVNHPRSLQVFLLQDLVRSPHPLHPGFQVTSRRLIQQ